VREPDEAVYRAPPSINTSLWHGVPLDEAEAPVGAVRALTRAPALADCEAGACGLRSVRIEPSSPMIVTVGSCRMTALPGSLEGTHGHSGAQDVAAM
jgi:hypothetical protein